MIQAKNYFMYSPGGENEGGDPGPLKDDSKTESTEPVPENDGEEKPLVEKIREALQDWSNKDQADQDFDDTRV